MKFLSYFRPKGPRGIYGRSGTTKVAELEKALKQEGYKSKLDEDSYTYYDIGEHRLYLTYRFGHTGLPYAWLVTNPAILK